MSLTIREINRVERTLVGELATGSRQTFHYQPSLVLSRQGVDVKLDQILAIDPENFPLHLDQKVRFAWTYFEGRRVVLRVILP